MSSAWRVLISRFARCETNTLRKLELYSALGITLFLVTLHLLLLLNRGPLWRDEISSLTLATQPTWLRFWQGLALDPCPPLFFLSLGVWSSLFGQSDFVLRTLGCLIGLGCLAGFWLHAKLTGRRTPILVLLLLGALPTLIIWGDSLRAYGLGVLFATFCHAFYWRVLARPNVTHSAGALLASVLAVHSLYIDALVVFACGLAAALMACHRRLWRRAALILSLGAFTAATLLPYAGLARATNEWAGLLRIEFPLTQSLRMLHFALLGYRNFTFWLWVSLTCVAVFVTITSLYRRKHRKDETKEIGFAGYSMLVSALVIAVTLAFFHIVGWGTNVWYYLPMLTVTALGIDAALDSRRSIRTAASFRVVFAIVGLLLSAPILFYATETRASNLDHVAQVVAKHATPSDLVVVWPLTDGITFQRYVQGEAPWVTIPPAPNLPTQPGDDFLEAYRDPRLVKRIFERIEATLRAGGRVWLASSWELVLPAGQLQPVLPLDKKEPRKLGYFLRGWGYLLAAQMRAHAAETRYVILPDDQPVSVYEHASLMVFTGWK